MYPEAVLSTLFASTQSKQNNSRLSDSKEFLTFTHIQKHSQSCYCKAIANDAPMLTCKCSGRSVLFKDLEKLLPAAHCQLSSLVIIAPLNFSADLLCQNCRKSEVG